MGQKGDLYGALHPLPWFIYLKKIKLRKIITKLLELYANSTQMDKIVRMSKKADMLLKSNSPMLGNYM